MSPDESDCDDVYTIFLRFPHSLPLTERLRRESRNFPTDQAAYQRIQQGDTLYRAAAGFSSLAKPAIRFGGLRRYFTMCRHDRLSSGSQASELELEVINQESMEVLFGYRSRRAKQARTPYNPQTPGNNAKIHATAGCGSNNSSVRAKYPEKNSCTPGDDEQTSIASNSLSTALCTMLCL